MTIADLQSVARSAVRGVPPAIREDLLAVALAAAAAAAARPAARDPVCYAARAARNSVIDALRRWQREPVTVSFDGGTFRTSADGQGEETREPLAEPAFVDFGEDSLLEDIDRKCGRSPPPELGEAERRLEQLLEHHCTRREREAVTAVYGLAGGYARTHAEAAEALGVTRPYVTMLVNAALRRMREAHEGHAADAA